MTKKKDWSALMIEAKKELAQIVMQAGKEQLQKGAKQLFEEYLKTVVEMETASINNEISKLLKVTTKTEILKKLETELYLLNASPQIINLQNSRDWQNGWVINQQPAAPESLIKLAENAAITYGNGFYWWNEWNKIQLDTTEKTVIAYLDEKIVLVKIDAKRQAIAAFVNLPKWDLFKGASNEPTETKQELEPEPLKKKEENLRDLITYEAPDKIIELIREKFKGVKGKGLKLLYLALIKAGLILEGRNGKKFHRCAKNEFDWEIAEYQAMQDYQYNERTDKEDLNKMIDAFKTIINADQNNDKT